MPKKPRQSSDPSRARNKRLKTIPKAPTKRSQITDQLNQQIIANVREGIILYDRHLRYLVWNPYMEELTGLRAEVVLGKRPRDLPSLYLEHNGKLQMDKKAVEGIEACVKKALAGETFAYMDIPIFIKETGVTGWTSARYGPFRNARGEIIGVIATVHDTTERRSAEEKLRNSGRQLAEAQQIARIGSWNWDIPTNVVTWSDELYRMFGLKPQAMPIAYETFLSFIHPEDRDKVNDAVQKMMKDHQPFHQDRRIVWRDGTVRIHHSQGRVEVDSAGHPIRMYGTAQDITDRKRAEEQLQQSEEELRKILTNIDEIIYSVIVKGDPLMSTVQFMSPRTEDIVGYRPEDFIEDDGLWFRILHPEDVPIVTESTRKFLEGRTTGIREYRLRHKETGEYRWMEDKIVPQVGESGKVIGFFGVARDITERKRADLALRESEQRYQTLAEVLPVGIFETDAQGDCLYVNNRWCEIAGQTAAQARGGGWGRAIHPEDRAVVTDEWYRSAREQTRFSMEYRFLRPNGAVTWVLGQALAKVAESGQVIGYIGTVTDITDRRRAEEAVKESEERFRASFKNAAVGMGLTDLSGRFMETNQALSDITGYSEEELKNLTFSDITHPDDRTGNMALYQEVKLGKRDGFVMQKRYVKKDGAIVWITLSVGVIRDRQGNITNTIGLIEDITERRRAEEALHESQRALSTLLSNLPGMVYRCRNDKDWTVEFASEGCLGLTGYQPSDLTGRKVSYGQDLIHSDDQEAVWNDVQAALREKRSYQLNYRIITADKKEKWVWEQGRGVFSPNGDLLALEGFIIDISERRQAVADLEKSVSLLRATFESTADGILVVDQQGRIASFNRKFLDLWRIPKSVVSSRDDSQALSFVVGQLKAPDAFLKKVKELYDQPDSESFDFIEFKDGRIFERFSQPHRIGDKTVGRVWSFRDVTERRWAEDALEKSEATNRALLNALPDMMFRINREGVYLDFIPAKGMVPFVPPMQFLGKEVREVLPPEVAEPIMHYVHQALGTGETQIFEYPLLEKGNRRDYEARIVVSGENEVLAIVRDITERKTQAAALEYQALHDTLTDLPNRTLVLDRLRQAIHAAGREGKPLALLLMDLDRFKDVNDALGHHHGDLLLKQVGPRVLGVLRESDTIARLGGDEFAVLLPGTDMDGATVTAQKILEALDRPFVVEGFFLDIGASIGIALFPEHGEDVDMLMRRADVAMYSAKQSSSGYAVYISEHDRHSPRRLALMGELRHAIERKEFILYYQPKVDLKTRRTIGVEALIRWKHPQHGLIQPDEFITLAEHTGFIKQLTFWVLSDALRQWHVWHQSGIDLPVAVNLSARNLQDLQMPDQFTELLRVTDVPPSQLKLEITESAIMADPARAMEILKRLRALDIRFSIDDFGAGYSSLGYLKKLPVDEVKVDKSFVMAMAASPDDVVIVRSTIDLAHNLGLRVVAEGVESQETLDRLAAMGCDAAQGFYLSRPIPAEELTHWLTESPWRLKNK
jgi:diguanylate cyclase (GGDEF)-like protein/PAS domain S-box-containing protein